MPAREGSRCANPDIDRAKWDVALVSPAVLVLAHDNCPVDGEMSSAGRGRVARSFAAAVPGYRSPFQSMDAVVANFHAVLSTDRFIVPGSSSDRYRLIA